MRKEHIVFDLESSCQQIVLYNWEKFRTGSGSQTGRETQASRLKMNVNMSLQAAPQ